jgi:hypothetical protein
MIFYRYPEEYSSVPHSSKDIAADIGDQILSPSDFKLNYPFIKSLQSKPAQDAINDSIVSLEGSLFTEHVLLNEKTDFKDVVSEYKVPLNEKGLISMLFDIYVYKNHSAHGMTYYASITANLETGEIYEFSDLFNPKIYYKKFLSEIVIKKVKEMKVPLIASFKGITENQQFYLTANSLVLYYKLYEYTPYYFGNFEIRIPFVEIKNLIGPMSPIKKLL